MAMRGGGTEDNTVGQSKLGFDFYKIIILNYIKKFYEQMQTVLTPPPPHYDYDCYAYKCCCYILLRKNFWIMFWDFNDLRENDKCDIAREGGG